MAAITNGKAAIIGCGVIGCGWAARFLIAGWDVAVFDPDPAALRRLDGVLAEARAALPTQTALPTKTALPTPAQGRLHRAASVSEAVQGARYIQESVPAQRALKRDVLALIQQAAPDTPTASSGGFDPLDLQQGAANPASILVARPMTPVHLLPVVALEPSAATDPVQVRDAMEILRAIAMVPICLGEATGVSLPTTTAPLHIARMEVLPSWTDYNGHMTESRYLFACSETTDAFLRLIGADLGHVASGFSYYTVETHIRHTGEARPPDVLTGMLQVLAADEKRLHVFVTIARDGSTLATIEQMLLHVDMAAGRACDAPPHILHRSRLIAAAHAGLSRPADAGRHVGQRPG